ncbi:GspH/FimT family pseudopilin [Marinicella rhabdoformis]|uniref:GspH/FimT family pseudopilin n=1 Tax=Marinicella rhabdoformis TaxID=2580566 RepID=UPI0015CFDCFA|nr:GspH/FimT family pseudopilin [Marinicella rhabdoformis]
MNNSPQTIKGFTLIEIIIGLALITILTGYGMPAYQNLKMNKDMTNAINQLIGGLNYARNQSIIRTEQIIVCPSSNLSSCAASADWHQGWMVFIDKDMNRVFDGSDEILTSENPMNEQLTAQSSAYRKLVRYDKMGASPGTNVTINFCDSRGSEYAKSVVINNIGRPRVSQSGSCG